MEGKKSEESSAYAALFIEIDRLKGSLSFSETDKLIEMLKKARKPGICEPEHFPGVKIYYGRSLKRLAKDSNCVICKGEREFTRNIHLNEIGLTKTLDMCLVHFDQIVTKNYAIAEMLKVKVRQATPKEMLSLLIQYPRILEMTSCFKQGRYGSLIALGIEWMNRGGSTLAAGISRPQQTAYLTKYHTDGCWDPNGYFVGVFVK